MPVTIHIRTLAFGVSVLKLFRRIEHSTEGQMIQRQILRSSTSIGANVVEAQHASSKREFIRYMQIALRSTRETEYWLMLCKQVHLLPDAVLQGPLAENQELGKIIATIILKARDPR